MLMAEKSFDVVLFMRHGKYLLNLAIYEHGGMLYVNQSVFLCQNLIMLYFICRRQHYGR